MENINTERLCLRDIMDLDADDMIRLLCNDVIKQTYMIPDLDQSAAYRLFLRFQELSKERDRFVRGISLENRLIGWINDLEFESGKMELGWVIDPAYCNQGYATEAVKAAIDYLFVHGVQTVFAGAFSENAASMRVMEKVGMHRLEKREQIEYRGKTHQCVFYEIHKN